MRRRRESPARITRPPPADHAAAVTPWGSVIDVALAGPMPPGAGWLPAPTAGSSRAPSTRRLELARLPFGICLLMKLYRSCAFRNGSRDPAPPDALLLDLQLLGIDDVGSLNVSRAARVFRPTRRPQERRVAPNPRRAGPCTGRIRSRRWCARIGLSRARARSAAVAPTWVAAHPAQTDAQTRCRAGHRHSVRTCETTSRLSFFQGGAKHYPLRAAAASRHPRFTLLGRQ